MKLKPGVKIQGTRPEILFAIFVAEGIYKEKKEEVVVTSLNDGVHSKGSLHYAGLAADLRTSFFTIQDQQIVTTKLIAALGDGYDVVLEDDHIHIEFQPKTA